MKHSTNLEPAVEAALLAAYGAMEPLSAEGRRRDRKEKRMAANPNDGRRMRATGRTAQLNVGIKPDVKAAIVLAAKRMGIPITVFIERAALAYIATGAKNA